MSAKIFSRIAVPGFHAWEDAPDCVSFLRNRHRHLFHIEIGYNVAHDDRALEFFMVQRELIQRMKSIFQRNDRGEFEFGTFSCEHIARLLMSHLNADYVIVTEDHENGSTVAQEGVGE